MIRIRPVLSVLLLAAPVLAAEGKWTPQQMLQLDPAMLRKAGLELPPERLWDEKRGTGLLAGTVNIGGCSGAFVSKEGLAVTNHHCVFSIVQEHTTPERNLLDAGFLAEGRAGELPSKSTRLYFPRRFVDVTAEIAAAVPAGASDLERFRAVDRKRKALQARCEEKPDTRCTVVSENGGLSWRMVEEQEVQDVRLVYAPPRAVGEYGGEIDNWSWPRHTGDFSIVRAYVGKDGRSAPPSPENVPLRPEFYFPLSPEGVSPGNFVMVLGYPGRTFRELLAFEVRQRAERYFPKIDALYTRYIDVLESVKTDPEKIAVASQLKSMHNRRKNAEGQLAGFARGKHPEKHQAHEEAVVAFARGEPRFQDALAARDALLADLQKRQEGYDRELLLSLVGSPSSLGPRALHLAIQVARISLEREKPDVERDPDYMERELPRLRDRLEREQKNYHPTPDAALLRVFVEEAQRLPQTARIAAIDATFGKKASPAELQKRIARLLRTTRVTRPDERKAMLQKSSRELRAMKDPLLTLGFAFADELMKLKEEEDRRDGMSLRLRPLWRAAVLAHAKRPIAPDANRTLRFSYAHVKGYSPKDGIFYTPQTTLGGLLAKATGQEPFAPPARVAQAAERRQHSRYFDKALGDVPVAFLSDADTTGGNSGSPVVDGKGRLVGVNFDRVWENVANDFRYDPSVARNISVDVRYLFWMLEEVEGSRARSLVEELSAKGH